ncbi:serine/threonine-protein phosphatase [Streptomyces sp. PLAI1-29]|uniref:Serine/threonine-protein phosphatase n=2 Tax=Streptomyces zingiberis TaxID=2053010 RepID=A0ABX1C5T9_9ACTN|nr:serine/threonine-protein phosphatase [Streptomyces zingiberis]
MMAAAVYTAPGTVATAVVAVLAGAFFNLVRGTESELHRYLDVASVLAAAATSVYVNRVVRHGHRALSSVRNVAEAAQRAVLPTPSGRIGGLRVAARYEAAQADAGIGGDLYAAQSTPHGLRLLVGDVRGKGMGAVGAVAILLGAFREAAEEEAGLNGIAHRLESALRREAKRREGLEQDEGFATALLAEIPFTVPDEVGVEGSAGGVASGHRAGSGPATNRVVRLLNRGHPAPLLLSPDGSTVRTLDPVEPALPLGLVGLAAEPDRVEELPFPPGHTLLVVTDGVTEARDRAGDFYDPVVRLSGWTFESPEHLLDALVADVTGYTGGGAHDDMALLAIRDGSEDPDGHTP